MRHPQPDQSLYEQALRHSLHAARHSIHHVGQPQPQRYAGVPANQPQPTDPSRTARPICALILAMPGVAVLNLGSAAPIEEIMTKLEPLVLGEVYEGKVDIIDPATGYTPRQTTRLHALETLLTRFDGLVSAQHKYKQAGFARSHGSHIFRPPRLAPPLPETLISAAAGWGEPEDYLVAGLVPAYLAYAAARASQLDPALTVQSETFRLEADAYGYGK